MLCPNCNALIDNGVDRCPECNVNLKTLKQENDFSDFYNDTTPQIDSGEKYAKNAKTLGIISLFFGPIFSIFSLMNVSKYKKYGNGQNDSKTKVGIICSLISIIITIFSFFLFSSFFNLSFLQKPTDNTETTTVAETQEETSIIFYDSENHSNDKFFDFGEQIYNAEQGYYLIFEKALPAEGSVVYNEHDVKITLKEFVIFQREFYPNNVQIVMEIEKPSNYTILGRYFSLNEEPLPYTLYPNNNTYTLIASSKSENIKDMSEFLCGFSVVDNNSGRSLFTVDLNLY